jgi:hypothetical protein
LQYPVIVVWKVAVFALGVALGAGLCSGAGGYAHRSFQRLCFLHQHAKVDHSACQWNQHQRDDRHFNSNCALLSDLLLGAGNTCDSTRCELRDGLSQLVDESAR